MKEKELFNWEPREKVAVTAKEVLIEDEKDEETPTKRTVFVIVVGQVSKNRVNSQI